MRFFPLLLVLACAHWCVRISTEFVRDEIRAWWADHPALSVSSARIRRSSHGVDPRATVCTALRCEFHLHLAVFSIIVKSPGLATFATPHCVIIRSVSNAAPPVVPTTVRKLAISLYTRGLFHCTP